MPLDVARVVTSNRGFEDGANEMHRRHLIFATPARRTGDFAEAIDALAGVDAD